MIPVSPRRGGLLRRNSEQRLIFQKLFVTHARYLMSSDKPPRSQNEIKNPKRPSDRESAHAVHVARTNERNAQNIDAFKQSESLPANLALANLAISSARPS